MTGARGERGLAGIGFTVDALVRLRGAARGLDPGARHAPPAHAGPRPSRFRGRGMDYAESRVYLPGDDIRTMDWRVTARTGRPHTKVFEEERERPVLLVVEVGPSMAFGTRRAFKSVLAAEAAALLAWAAIARGDRIGVIACSRDAHREVRPAGGRRGVLAVLRALADVAGRPPAPAAGAAPLLAGALERTRRVARPGGLVVVVSDFYGLDADAERHLGRLRAHSDLACVWVHDRLEAEPPPPGRYAISDGRGREVLDSASPSARSRYAARFAALRTRLEILAGRLGAPLVAVACGDDTAEALRRGLAPRARRARPAA